MMNSKWVKMVKDMADTCLNEGHQNVQLYSEGPNSWAVYSMFDAEPEFFHIRQLGGEFSSGGDITGDMRKIMEEVIEKWHEVHTCSLLIRLVTNSNNIVSISSNDFSITYAKLQGKWRKIDI